MQCDDARMHAPLMPRPPDSCRAHVGMLRIACGEMRHSCTSNITITARLPSGHVRSTVPTVHRRLLGAFPSPCLSTLASVLEIRGGCHCCVPLSPELCHWTYLHIMYRSACQKRGTCQKRHTPRSWFWRPDGSQKFKTS